MAEEVKAEAEARYAEGAAREYRNEKIAVYWEPGLCIHARACVALLRDVFRPMDAPCIHVDAAEADRIAEVINRCPTGALRYERLDGAPQEEPQDPPTISAMPNGPYYVRGRLTIRDRVTGLERQLTRAALCRCGNSENKPFCDNSHLRTGFTTTT